ncbi:MAG: 3-isopropylmalate dehydratase [Lachnospiraceae bacterium]|jgi:3-isopropylmalate/(R)-2-methylmalate dehydratase small subunit|nr:3-isopropylmalate dehydratase [Lachnospiraceae bacterium]
MGFAHDGGATGTEANSGMGNVGMENGNTIKGAPVDGAAGAGDVIHARIWALGDDIDTDIIIPTEYLAMKTVEDMKPYAFSPLRPELAGMIAPGDVIVAGKNFGCGSSREQAPEIIKALGVACVVAKSFARIFFRNAINNGLLLIEQGDLPDAVREGDGLDIVVNREIIYRGRSYPIAPLPENMLDIIKAGGLVNAMRRKNGQC